MSLLCTVHGPDTCSSSQVENALRALANWGKVELPIKEKTVNVVNQVHSVLFLLIVWLSQNISF